MMGQFVSELFEPMSLFILVTTLEIPSPQGCYSASQFFKRELFISRKNFKKLVNSQIIKRLFYVGLRRLNLKVW